MNTTLQQDICDVLGTIFPDKKTVKKFENLSPSNEDAQVFLLLLESPFFFKSVVCTESPEHGFAKQVFKCLQNGAIKDEWMEFKEAYLYQISKSISYSPYADIVNYINFELELEEKVIDACPNDNDIIEKSKQERFDLEVKTIRCLKSIIADDRAYKHQKEVRIFLETIVILNCEILENAEFEYLFNQYKPVLTALLAE